MNYEEQISELKKRIEILEKEENKRKAKRKRKIIFEIVKFLIIIGLIMGGYLYIYNNFVKPYKEKIDYFEQKVDNVENFIDKQWDNIQKYNPFS